MRARASHRDSRITPETMHAQASGNDGSSPAGAPTGTHSLPPGPELGLPLPQRYRAIVVVALGITLAVLDSAIANVALPTIARDLHASEIGRAHV